MAIMEHRYGERRSVDQIVLIRKRTWQGWVIGRMRNVSFSGAFVEVPRDVLAVLSQVRLELEIRRQGTPHIVHCNAMVVHVTHGGIGLAFEEQAPDGLGT